MNFQKCSLFGTFCQKNIFFKQNKVSQSDTPDTLH